LLQPIRAPCAPGGREHECWSATVGKHSVSNLSQARRFPAVPLAAARGAGMEDMRVRGRGSGRASV